MGIIMMAVQLSKDFVLFQKFKIKEILAEFRVFLEK